jgi:hypothetical protein
MATTKKKTPKKSKKSAQSAGHRARIRMYRVGLGDCFLLTFYTQARPRNILIDCGMFAGSRLDTTQKEKDVQLAVVKSIVSETKGKLDAVVVTHEHMDHVSIFNSAQDVFKDLTFDEAWFGWVEDPKNKDAQKLREKYEGLKMALAAALTGLHRPGCRWLYFAAAKDSNRVREEESRQAKPQVWLARRYLEICGTQNLCAGTAHRGEATAGNGAGRSKLRPRVCSCR